MAHPGTEATPRRSIDLRDEVDALRSRLASAEASFHGIVERSSDGVVVVDRHGVARFANAAAFALLGRSPDELVGAEVGFAVLAGDVAEVELVRPAGEVVFAEMRVVDTEWEGQPCLLALLRDVTDRHQVQAQLAARATHDHLTGLPNRFLLEDRLGHALDQLRRTPGSLALFMADLDGFKAVNDRWGHAAGDAVLIEAARRLRSALRPADTVARFGGDEFMMLCESMDRKAATELTGRLMTAFREPFLVAGESLVLGLSLGFVLADGGETSAHDLMVAADDQMYEHKGRHRPSPAGAPESATAGTWHEAARPQYRFTLYVAGASPRSAAAVEDVDRLCQQYLRPGTFSVRVVDVLRAADEADSARVLVTPTLARLEPLPVVRAIGDLSDTDVLAAALGLGHPGA